MSFERKLELGNVGEKLVVGYLKDQGFGVIPSYEFSGRNNDKAPKLCFKTRGFVTPDLDVCGIGKRFWNEVKTYHGPAFNRAMKCDVHGINRRHYDDYLAVEHESGCPVFITILEIDSGELLLARLARLKTFPCMCPGCKSNNKCYVRSGDGIARGVYWPRAAMQYKHTFSDAEMRQLRLMKGAA